MCGLILIPTWQHCSSVILGSELTYCRVHTMELWLLADDNNSYNLWNYSDHTALMILPTLVWLSTLDCDCVWPHLLRPLIPGDRLDQASSQSDKLWWVFQSKHNWSSLLTSNLYSARVHLTRHCRPGLASPHLTQLSFTVPDHFTIWGNKQRARCCHQPY